MPIHTVTERSTNTLTSARGPSLAAAAASGFKLREVGVFNTAATEVRIGLARITAVGSGGTALTETDWDANLTDTQCTAANTPTADHTVGDKIRIAVLGAAIGSGIIWTFGGSGLIVPEGTSNGIAIYLPGGTAQVVDFYFDWEE